MKSKTLRFCLLLTCLLLVFSLTGCFITLTPGDENQTFTDASKTPSSEKSTEKHKDPVTDVRDSSETPDHSLPKTDDPEETESSSESESSQTPSDTTLQIISITDPAHKGNDATLTALGKPNTQYTISVFYSSGPSSASGLGPKISDENGYISWTWKVGGRTYVGKYKIEVYGDGEKVITYFNVSD